MSTNFIDQVIHSATRKPEDDITALVLPYNGIFEHFLSFLPIKKHCANTISYQWNLPLDHNSNYVRTWDQFNIGHMTPNHVDYDLIISSNPSAIELLESAQNELHVQAILCIHETANNLTKTFINNIMERYKKCNNPNIHLVFPNQMIADEWIFDKSQFNFTIIPYGVFLPSIDDEGKGWYSSENAFNDKQLKGIDKYDEMQKDKFIQKTELVNAFLDFPSPLHPNAENFINTLLDKVPECQCSGFNDKSTSNWKSYKDIVSEIIKSEICIFHCPAHTPPFYALIAALLEKIIIINKTKWTENLFKANCLYYNDVNEISNYIKNILNNTRSNVRANPNQSEPNQFLRKMARMTKLNQWSILKSFVNEEEHEKNEDFEFIAMDAEGNVIIPKFSFNDEYSRYLSEYQKHWTNFLNQTIQKVYIR